MNQPIIDPQIAEPSQVKSVVAHDLKLRYSTQKAAGEKIGFGRQTMSTILSNGEYFTEKQAVLFSLAFGYDKEYLMTGKGRLLSPSSPEGISEALEYRSRQLNIFRKTQEMYAIGLDLIIKHGVEECKPLIDKLCILNKFIKALEQFVNDGRADLKFMEGAELMFAPFYQELTMILKKQYGIDIDTTP